MRFRWSGVSASSQPLLGAEKSLLRVLAHFPGYERTPPPPLSNSSSPCQLLWLWQYFSSVFSVSLPQQKDVLLPVRSLVCRGPPSKSLCHSLPLCTRSRAPPLVLLLLKKVDSLKGDVLKDSIVMELGHMWPVASYLRHVKKASSSFGGEAAWWWSEAVGRCHLGRETTELGLQREHLVHISCVASLLHWKAFFFLSLSLSWMWFCKPFFFSSSSVVVMWNDINQCNMQNTSDP